MGAREMITDLLDGFFGGRTADLGVSSANPGARRICERLGFTLRHDVTRYATMRCDLLARMGS